MRKKNLPICVPIAELADYDALLAFAADAFRINNIALVGRPNLFWNVS